MARIAFRDLVAEPKFEVVAVWADQADAPLDLGVRRRASASSSAASKNSTVSFRPSICSTLLRYWIAAGRDAGASSW